MPGQDDDKTVFGQPRTAAPRRSLSAERTQRTVFDQPLPAVDPNRTTPPTRRRSPAPPGGTRPSPPVVPEQRIALADALHTGQEEAAAHHGNPLVAQAAPILTLLGRLRTGRIDMQPAPLIAHVTRALDRFEQGALSAHVPPQETADAKFVLAATVDDVFQNLPGAPGGPLEESAIAQRMFGEPSSGNGVFRRLDEALRVPGPRLRFLELVFLCLSLGYEGQHRGTARGAVELSRIRSGLYDAIRRVQPHPQPDISVNWRPVALGRARGGLPVWVVTAIAAAMVVALFATLSTLVTKQAAQVQAGLLNLHRGLPPVTIQRTEPVIEPYVAPPSTQMDRMESALETEIETGVVELVRSNDWVFFRVGDALQFPSGDPEPGADITALTDAIARALEPESGPIRVVGHSDDVPLTGRGRYRTNEELSAARAQVVADSLAQGLSDPSRIVVEGMGPVQPIADNATPEGRALNRRVEIMVERAGE